MALRMNVCCYYLLALSILPMGQSSIIEINADGMYSRVTVKISDQVPRQLCRAVLDNVEVYITTTSKRLYDVTESQFSDVTILLPSTWTGNEDCLAGRNISLIPSDHSLARLEDPDFSIVGPHPIYGGEPWVEQFGQCRTSSRGVNIPFPYLTQGENQTDLNKEVRIFDEWLLHRYGVFPDVGFLNDPMYPDQYVSAFGLKSRTQGCNSSSYYDGANHVVGLCDHVDYNPNSPTKQNLLCMRQLPQDIIRNSEDFKDRSRKKHLLDETRMLLNSNKVNNASFEEWNEDGSVYENSIKVFSSPIFRYAKIPSGGLKRVVVVVDITKNIGDGESWRKIRDNLYRFIMHLNFGTELAVVTFGADSARVNVPLTQIRETNRQGLHGRVPFRQLEDETGRLELGLEAALESLAETGTDSSSILVLTGPESLANIGSNTIMGKVRGQIYAEAIPVYQVIFETSDRTRSAKRSGQLKDLTKFGGKYVVTPGGSKSTKLQHLSGIFIAFLKASSGPQIECTYKKVFEKDLKRYPSENTIDGTFFVEEEMNSNLLVMLTTPSQEDAETFEVTSPSGRTFSFPKYEHGVVYFHFDAKNNEGGVWSYTARLNTIAASSGEEEDNPVWPGTISVEVFGERNLDNAVALKFWTNRHYSVDNTEIIMYAKVSQDALPILNAEILVTVDFVRTDGNTEDRTFQLRDLGTGYPDITKNDGIYSAYLIHVPSDVDFFTFNVKATHNNGQARIPKPFGGSIHDKDGQACCGSALPEMFTIPAQPFERHLIGQSLDVEKTFQDNVQQQQNNEDPYPPSRISDLTLVNYLNDSLFATLSWTAPGGDLNTGKAYRYEVRCFTTPDGLSEENFLTKGILMPENLLPYPAEAGTKQTASISLPWANELFYYGIVAFDKDNNRGLVSNLAPAFIVEVTTSTSLANLVFKVVNTTDEDLGDSLKHMKQAIDNNTMIYLIAGCITAFLLILISMFAAAIYRSKRRRHFLKEIPPPAPQSNISSPIARPPQGFNDLNSRSQNIYVLNSSSSTNSLPAISSYTVGLSDQPMSTLTTSTTLPEHAFDKHSSSYDVWNIPPKEHKHAIITKKTEVASLFSKRSPTSDLDNYVGNLMGFPSLPYISSPRLISTTRGPVSLMNLNASAVSSYPDMSLPTANHLPVSLSSQNLSSELPLQVFRSSSVSEDAPSSSAGDHSPTYQNWSTTGGGSVSVLKTNKSSLGKLNRVNSSNLGTGVVSSDCATSSTECSHSDEGESDTNGSPKTKNIYNVSSARITTISTPPQPAPRSALSSKQQLQEQEKKKRQESLV